MTSFEIDEYLHAIIMAELKNPIEADKLFNQYLDDWKKQGHSKQTVRDRYKELKAGYDDKQKLLKQKASGLKVVGGTDTGDAPAKPRTFEVDTSMRGVATEDVRKILGESDTVLAFGPDVVEICYQPIAGLWSDPEKTIPAKFARPMTLDKHRALAHIEKVCSWQVFNLRKMAMVEKPVPEWCAAAVASGSNEHFKPLAGLIRHPVLTVGNELLSGQIGYDKASQFFVWSPPAPEDPTPWESPQAAFRWLVDDWLGEFQFATPADAARAILIPLTLLKARTTLAKEGKYPAFMITAPQAGSGKTWLARALVNAIMIDGATFARWPRGNDEEMVKILTSICVADPTCVLFDNVPNGMTIESAAFDDFITNTGFGGRLLGKNEMASSSYPNLALVVLDGNNIEVTEDTRSRVVEIRLEPIEANPHNHVYERDVMRFTNENRPKILSALIEIARDPAASDQIGRFPAWHRHVATKVIAASGETAMLDAWKEINATMRNGDAYDSLLRRLLELQGQWSGGVWPKDVIEHALEEYDALVHLKTEDRLAATAMMDPERNTEAQNEAIAAERKAARKRLSGNVIKRLKRWKDARSSGGFKLRINKEWNDHGDLREILRVESCEAKNPEQDSSALNLPF